MARQTFRFVDGQFVEVTRERDYSRPMGAMIQSDLPEYESPITGLPIDGRAARREDLARNNCREVDPSEKFTMME